MLTNQENREVVLPPCQDFGNPATIGTEFIRIHEFIGLAERVTKEHAQSVKHWASLLIQRADKDFGALGESTRLERISELAEHHPNFSEVVDWILNELAFAGVAGHGLEFQRILLVGPAGTGKTTFALELAHALEVPVEVVAMNQSDTPNRLTGTETHWATSQPGEVLRLLAQSRVINPLIVLDEIDKTTARGAHGYDPLNGLYTLLERRTARVFADSSLPGVHLNASYVNWIATANDLDSINPALISRFNVFHIRLLSKDELKVVVDRTYQTIMKDNPGIRRFVDSQLPDDVTAELVKMLETGRDIDRMLRAMIGRSIRTGERLSGNAMRSRATTIRSSRTPGFY